MHVFFDGSAASVTLMNIESSVGSPETSVPFLDFGWKSYCFVMLQEALFTVNIVKKHIESLHVAHVSRTLVWENALGDP